MIAATFSFRLKPMACHPSYPLNSENANPPGTFTVYLSCADMTNAPRTPSHTVAIPIVSLLMRFIAAPRVSCLHGRVMNYTGRTTPNLLDDGIETWVALQAGAPAGIHTRSSENLFDDVHRTVGTDLAL